MNGIHLKRTVVAHAKPITLLGTFCALQYASLHLVPWKTGHTIFSKLLIKSLAGFICTVPIKLCHDRKTSIRKSLSGCGPVVRFSGVLFALSALSPTIERCFSPVLVSFLKVFGVPNMDIRWITTQADDSKSRLTSGAVVGIFQCMLLCALLVSSTAHLSAFAVVMLALFTLLLTMRNRYSMVAMTCEYTDVVIRTSLLVISLGFFLMFGSLPDLKSPGYVAAVVLDSLSSFVVKPQLMDAMEQYGNTSCVHTTVAIKLLTFIKACLSAPGLTVVQLGTVVLLSVTGYLRSIEGCGDDKVSPKIYW